MSNLLADLSSEHIAEHAKRHNLSDAQIEYMLNIPALNMLTQHTFMEAVTEALFEVKGRRTTKSEKASRWVGLYNECRAVLNRGHSIAKLKEFNAKYPKIREHAEFEYDSDFDIDFLE